MSAHPWLNPNFLVGRRSNPVSPHPEPQERSGTRESSARLNPAPATQPEPPAPPPTLTPSPSPLTPPSTHPPFLWFDALSSRHSPLTSRPWLWHGFLAPGVVTLLTSQWKSGKTTLVSILLSRMKFGGELAGLPVAAGKAVLVSEEDADLWAPRCHKLDLTAHVGGYLRPFPAKPSRAEWQSFVESLGELRERQGVSLVVIDPLAAFLPGRENDADSMLDGLLPLRRLAAHGLAVLILHHPRKGDAAPGQAARGSGVLTAHADVVIEMLHTTQTTTDRRRRLRAYSRFDETPRATVIELNADGTDYLVHETLADDELNSKWEIARELLKQAPHKQTRKEIRLRWPSGSRPDASTVFRLLESAVAQSLLHREGAGLKNDPYRYWLPEAEAAVPEAPVAPVLPPGPIPDPAIGKP